MDALHPLETLPFYENDIVQKVYWTDDKNQPRSININDNNINSSKIDTFDFVKNLSLKEDILIEKSSDNSGTFPMGTIQYSFTYFDKFGVESSVFYTSPLYYSTHKEIGGSVEQTASSSFRISIKNADINFEYIRIYSILRTSINSTPIIRKVVDLSTSNTTAIVDSGDNVIDVVEVSIPDYFEDYAIPTPINIVSGYTDPNSIIPEAI